MFRSLYGVFVLCLVLPVSAQTALTVPKDATGWFQRASDLMNLRMPGSAPFHMKVAFHALPGIEMTKKPQIVIGDGVYEETWLAPRQWRREVTLGSYHAVEVQNDRTRKMQASSDYEPSRVLMLLEALLNPIPRNLVSPELDSTQKAWKIERHTADNLAYVRISRTKISTHSFVIEYILLPNGLLVESNQLGLTTGWQDDYVFGGRAVPKHFTVQAAGRNVLTAEVAVEAAGKVDPAVFDLPGGPADPGMTLRPLHRYETNHLSILNPMFSYIGNSPSANATREIIDRHGVVREAEVLTAAGLDDMEPVLYGMRQERWHPAEIDGDPCEIAFDFYH